MDYDIINIDNNFYNNAIKTNKLIANLKIEEIKLPRFKFLDNGESYYAEIMSKIDSAKDYIMIIAYTFDNSSIANIIMQKIVHAAERGVKVNLFIDDLQSKPDSKLESELISKGGNIHKLNKVHLILNLFNREFFKRDHEKVLLIDNKVFIGSANISNDYAGKHYGSYFFKDLNIYLKNICINDILYLFYLLAEYHNILFEKNMSNINFIEKYNEKYFDTKFKLDINDKMIIHKSFLPEITELQTNILNNIKNAKKSIKIIVPYYYPIKKIDKALIEASKKGIKVELITAKKRDIPCYKDLRNSYLFKHLIDSGIDVYEFKDKYLHVKSFLFDDEILSVGSFNLDKWSWKNNNEVNFNTNNKDILKDYIKIYNNIKEYTTIATINNDYYKFEKFFRVQFWTFFLFICHNIMIYMPRFKFIRKEEKEETENN